MRKASLKTLLEYTPYDNKCPSPFGLRAEESEEENRFYDNNLFVDYPESCNYLRDKLSDYIDEQIIHLIFFSGSSGSGKTTFLKNYFRIKKDEYNSRYINLVEYPSAIGNDNIVTTTLKAGLKLIFSRNVAKLLYEKYMSFNSEKSTTDLSFFLPSELDRFMSFCESFSQDDSSLVFEVEMEQFNFYHNGDLSQLLSLYLISSIIPFTDDEKPFVFIFDNLDEVDKQYICSVLSSTISTAYSYAQTFCQGVLHYNFTWNVTFLLSVRMENLRFLKVNDIQERTEELHKNPDPLEFSQDFQALYTDILNVRLQYYENNCLVGKPNETLIKENYDSLLDLLHSEDVFFKRFIKPLYSYDYRMYTHFAISDLLQYGKLLVPKSLLSLDDKFSHQGARGMLLFYSLLGLMRRNTSRFLSYVNEEFSNDTCNIYRMSFTLLSNMSGWSRRKEAIMELLEDRNDFNEKTGQVDMTKFLEPIKRWYKDEQKKYITKVLEGLIGTSANSFECPIMLFGEAIDKFISSLGDKFSVAALADKVVREYLNDPDSLESVKIQINPLCIVYSARVFIHYEYFNLISPNMMRATKNENIDYKPKPLFQLIKVDDDRADIEKCLYYTFETAKTIIEKADGHFCKICKAQNNDSCVNECKSFIDKFIKEGFSFNNTIHATRIISAHIHYLENYRHYIWNTIGNSNNHSDEEIEIQNIVINQILKYIEFYEKRKVRDDLYETITNNFKKQYEDALKELINSKQYPTVDLVIKKEHNKSQQIIV